MSDAIYEEKILVASIVRRNRIFRKSPLLFYVTFLGATSLPLVFLLIFFPPLFIDDWMTAYVWAGGLGWHLPWPLMALSCAAPTLIIFLLVTADKSSSEAVYALTKVAESGEDITQTRFLYSPWIDLGGILVAVLIFLYLFWPAFEQGIPLVTAELHPTWPVAVYMSLNFFAWWFLAGQFASFMLILTLFFIFKVRKMGIKCDWNTLNSWIRPDYVGGLKPVGAAMLRIFRWFLLIQTLAVIGFWMFQYRGYLIFVLYASLFPIFSYVAVAFSLHAIVERSKKKLFKIVETSYRWHEQAPYFHYIAQIDDWPIPFKALREPFYAIIFWFITSFVIPQLIEVAGIQVS